MIREKRKMLSGIEIFKFFVSDHLNKEISLKGSRKSLWGIRYLVKMSNVKSAPKCVNLHQNPLFIISLAYGLSDNNTSYPNISNSDKALLWYFSKISCTSLIG